MPGSMIYWLLAVVALSWLLGAYNRLVLLRAQVRTAFGVLDLRWSQYAAIVAEYCAAQTSQPPGDLRSDDVAASRAGLLAACTQFEASLRASRKGALDAKAGSALKTAHEVLQTFWERQAASLSAPVQRQWSENMALASDAVLGFDRCVQDYNAAIAQFPALILAFLFSFQPARCLGAPRDAGESLGD